MTNSTNEEAGIDEEEEQQGPLPLRRLLALAKPEWRRLTTGTIALLLAAGIGLLFPLAIGRVVDAAVEGGSSELVDRWALILVGALLLQSVLVFVRHYLFAIAGERIVATLRAQLYERVFEQELAFFDKSSTGKLSSRLATDTVTLQGAVTDDIASLLTDLSKVVLGLAFLSWLSPELTLWMLATVPPVAIAAVLFGRRIHGIAKAVQDALAKANEAAQEALSSVRTVRSFGAEARESGRYRERVWKVFAAARRQTIVVSLFGAVAWFAGFGAVAFVFWYGGRKVVKGELSVGELTSFLVYTLTIAMSFAGLAGVWGQFMRAGGASQRIFAISDRKPAMALVGGRKPGRVVGELCVDGVDFHYPSRPAQSVLKNVSFTVKPGELVALVGPSGSGKSTIAALVSRFYDPDRGKLTLDGVDLRELDATWLRERVGVVAQEPVLFSASIAENVRYGKPGASLEEVQAACRASNASEFIEAFPDGYETEVGERGVRLSGGQKQRVAIARAILKDPRLLVLDEATSALDSESELLVQEALGRLVAARTTIVIAHRLSTVRDADRVLVLDAGRIVQEGKHDELMAMGGMYRRLVRRQFEADSAQGASEWNPAGEPQAGLEG